METVTSADGTVIAYDRVGTGPVLIVCVGAFCTRATFVAPDDLARQFTVVTYDRRGRGDSGDTAPFTVEREYEDLAAVAAGTGSGAPFVFGHSSGAAIALRAAAAGLPAAGVVAYEAPFGNDETPTPAVDLAERIGGLVTAGRNREAVTVWMTDVVRLPDQALASLDSAPWVTALEPLARTLPYEMAVTAGGVPAGELGTIAAPVLILGGGDSPAWFRRSVAEQAAAIPGAQLRMLDGFGHNVPPEVIAPMLIDFFAGAR
ncbi:MAG TPA: alpha/beta hydrolase [Trebonia sp.]|jgi:pimeloyl-ACP methyl ester carboxylesterase|nr:alpha/beta hydrolase [Trebonia sp.]